MSDLTFGSLLKLLIKRSGRSMAGFAEEVSLSPSALSRLVSGKRAPKGMPISDWAEALGASATEKEELVELALLAQAPEALRRRFERATTAVDEERRRRTDLESNYGNYRHTQQYFDGYWLAYNYHFHNDGRLMRSLCHIEGDEVEWLVMDRSQVHYSYTGKVEVLGDKVFLRLAEDRGDSEYIQVTCDSLFDYQDPAFLYGLVTGISGRDIRHSTSTACAARMVMIYVGQTRQVRGEPEKLERLQACLGTYLPQDITPFWGDWLGPDNYLRDCLRLRPREDIDALLMRMLDNQLEPGDTVLQACFH